MLFRAMTVFPICIDSFLETTTTTPLLRDERNFSESESQQFSGFFKEIIALCAVAALYVEMYPHTYRR